MRLQNLEDLSALLFSPDSLQLHVQQALAVLESAAAAPELPVVQESAISAGDATSAAEPEAPSPSRVLATRTTADDGASGESVRVRELMSVKRSARNIRSVVACFHTKAVHALVVMKPVCVVGVNFRKPPTRSSLSVVRTHRV